MNPRERPDSRISSTHAAAGARLQPPLAEAQQAEIPPLSLYTICKKSTVVQSRAEYPRPDVEKSTVVRSDAAVKAANYAV